MNRENNKCETSGNYSFLHCVYTTIISDVGCQPKWIDFMETDFKHCEDISKVTKFSDRLTRSLLLDELSLFDEYKCLIPCNFIEYKVKQV